jgi:fatty-acid desaturase
MIKYILKANQWYDNLKEPKRFLFALMFVFIPLGLSNAFMHTNDNKWSIMIFPAFCLLIMLFRMTPVINDLRNGRK